MRIISFRFDDGLWEGARKAVSVLNPYKASFFIVKNWLEDFDLPVLDEYNRGRYHGSIALWKEMSAMGQDIQAHSCTHQRFSSLSKAERDEELSESIRLIRKIHDGPYFICYPYNDITPDNLTMAGYDAAGFETRPSSTPINWNNTSNLDVYRLKSWAIREENFFSICDQIKALPPDSWTILAMHSLDGEGFSPWNSSNLKHLVEFISDLDFEILSIQEAYSKLCIDE